MHHRVRLFGIARPIVEDVAIGRIPAKKIGAGERPEKQCSMVECEGQRNRRRRRSDIADEAEDMVLVAKDLHGVGCVRRLVAVVRRHESQESSVHASRVIDLAEGGLDADLHLAAELPGSATERRRHPEHDLLVGDAASGVLLRSARLRRGRGSGISGYDRRGVGDVQPWRRWGRTHGFARSFRVRGRAIRRLRSSRRCSRGAQALHQTQELRSQCRAAQLVGEARNRVTRGTFAQPLEAFLVTSTDFILRRSHDL